MKVTRIVPGRPVNDAESTVKKVASVIVGSLSPSPHIDTGQVEAELREFGPTLGLLAVGGHLGKCDLVLIAPGLRLQIEVPVGERAMNATENVNAARGAAKAATWTLYVPTPPQLAVLIQDVVKRCLHVSVESPPGEEPVDQGRSLASSINLGRLAEFGGKK